MRYVPGVHADCAVLIMPVIKRAFTQTISLGVQVTIVKDALPILVNNVASTYHLCLYAGLEIGKLVKN